MTPDKLLDEFMRHLRVERGLSSNTCLSYRYQLERYVVFLRSGGLGPASAARGDVISYLERRKGEGLKLASLFIAAMVIRQFHRYLAQADPAASDPTAGMRLPRFKQRIPQPLDTDAIERLLQPPQTAKFTALRDHAMLELMYATGMRVSELVNLKLGQLDVKGGWVRVMGKGDKERLVPVGQCATEAMKRYLATRADRFPAIDDTLFLNNRGGQITRGGFALQLLVAARRAGISARITPHILRHSTATHMLQGGASIRVIQEMLGHSALSTTIQRYAHVSPEFLRRVCEKAHPAFASGRACGEKG